MAYIGVSPSNGTRRVHTYTATASQTSFSGAGAEGATLSYKDSNFVDVYQNGVKLGDADYTATSGTAIVLAQGASVNDLIEVVVYDVFSVADTVSKADGGTFDGNVTMAGTLDVTGASTLTGALSAKGGAVFNEDSADVDFRVEGNNSANLLFVDGGNDHICMNTSTDAGGVLNIKTTDNTANLVLFCTDADDSGGPILDLFRNSSSPADGDVLGLIRFKGEDAGSNETTYAQIIGFIQDEAGGAEDGTLKIETLIGGSSQSRVDMTSTETVFNEGSQNIDFRVESDGNANMLFVDGGNNSVGLGSSSPDSGRKLHIEGGDTTVGITLKDTAGTQFGINSDDNALKVKSDSSGAELMRIDSSGNLLFNLTNRLFSDTSNTINASVNGSSVLRLNRGADAGTVVQIGLVGTSQGTISISGTTVSYNAFSGSHWSRLTDNSKPTILKGTIIETIDEMCDWYQLEFEVEVEGKNETVKRSYALQDGDNVGDTVTYKHEGSDYTATIVKEDDNKHTKCKISDTADSKRVYGVHADWDNDDDTVNDMYVTAVGTHVVRINKDVTVTAGDLLSSNGDGTAKVQDDDIIRSKTIGKVLTNIKQETYSDGSYTVPCALYCG